MSDEEPEEADTSQWIQVNKRSWVWSHFKIDKNDKTRVKCDQCPRIYKHSSSTTDLMRHLSSVHLIKKPGTGTGDGDQGAGPSGSLVSSDQPKIRNAFAKIATEPLDLVCVSVHNSMMCRVTMVV